VDAATQHGQEANVAKGTPTAVLWVTCVVALGKCDASCKVDNSSQRCQNGMRQSSCGQKEQKLGIVLQSVLMSPLDTIEHVVTPIFIAVHYWVFDFVLLSGHSNIDSLVNEDKNGSSSCQNDVSKLAWHFKNHNVS